MSESIHAFMTQLGYCRTRYEWFSPWRQLAQAEGQAELGKDLRFGEHRNRRCRGNRYVPSRSQWLGERTVGSGSCYRNLSTRVRQRSLAIYEASAMAAAASVSRRGVCAVA